MIVKKSKDNQETRVSGHKIGHLTTFRAQLVSYIKLKDLFDANGEWMTVMTDDVLQYTMTELSRVERIELVPENLYSSIVELPGRLDAKGIEVEKFNKKLQ